MRDVDVRLDAGVNVKSRHTLLRLGTNHLARIYTATSLFPEAFLAFLAAIKPRGHE